MKYLKIKNFLNKFRNGLAQEDLNMLKYDLTFFRKPNLDKDEIASEISSLKEFDLVDEENDNTLSGHLKKRFAMLPSEYFNELFSENNNSYKTYIDDAIENGYKSQYLSCLIKVSDLYNSRLNSIASKFCNFFNLPVSYDTYYLGQNPSNLNYIISVDFICPNERFFSLEDVDSEYIRSWGRIVWDRVGELNKSLLIYNHTLNVLSKKYGIKLNKSDKINLNNDFLYSYLIRTILLADIDFDFNNFGILVNIKDKKIRNAPNFDLEMSSMRTCIPFMTELYEDLLNYYKFNYENIFNYFVKKLKEFTYEDSNHLAEFKKIILNTHSFNLPNRQSYCPSIDYNIELYIKEIYDLVIKVKYKKEKEI